MAERRGSVRVLLTIFACACASLGSGVVWPSSGSGVAFGAAMERGVRLAPAHTVGRVMVFDLTHRTTMGEVGDGESPDLDSLEKLGEGQRRIEQTLRIRLTTLAVDDRGRATYAAVFPSARTRVLAGAAEGGEGEGNEDRARNGEGALAAEVDAAFREAALRIDVDESGRVRTVTGLEPVLTAARSRGPEGIELMGLFAPASVRRNLSNLWRVDDPVSASEDRPARGRADAPAFHERRVGAAWELEDRARVGSLGSLVSVATLRLVSVEGGTARVEGPVVMRIEPPPGEPDPSLPDLMVVDGRARMIIGFDVAGGHITERRVEADATLISSLLGRVEHRQRVSSRVAYVLVESVEAP